jgi:hypothetical protein
VTLNVNRKLPLCVSKYRRQYRSGFSFCYIGSRASVKNQKSKRVSLTSERRRSITKSETADSALTTIEMLILGATFHTLNRLPGRKQSVIHVREIKVDGFGRPRRIKKHCVNRRACCCCCCRIWAADLSRKRARSAAAAALLEI